MHVVHEKACRYGNYVCELWTKLYNNNFGYFTQITVKLGTD